MYVTFVRWGMGDGVNSLRGGVFPEFVKPFFLASGSLRSRRIFVHRGGRVGV